MKKQPFHFLLLALFAFLFTHCSMEKRLYNKGYHIEHKQSFHANKTARTDPPKTDIIAADETNDQLHSEDQYLAPEMEETSEVKDSTVMAAPEKIVKDTVYIYDDYEENIRRKERRLLFTGIPTLLVGLLAASALSTATAAGATIGEFVILGAIGWVCAFIAFILLMVFLVFLLIPANPGEVRYSKKEDPKLSGSKNGGLIAFLVVFGLIGAFILVANVL